MTNTISDDILTAYLDGEVTDEERLQIEKALDTNPDVAERLETLDIPRHDLQMAFDAVLSTAPPLPQQQPVVPSVNWLSRVAAVLLVAVGVSAGAFWSPLSKQNDVLGWKMAIANYQVLYVPETLAAAPAALSVNEEKLAALSTQLGRDLTNAVEVDGLDFRRAQMLGLNEKPLVQIAYLSDNNIPFAICVTPVSQDPYDTEVEHLAGLAAAHWVDDGFGYLVIGGDDLGVVSQVANGLRGQI